MMNIVLVVFFCILCLIFLIRQGNSSQSIQSKSGSLLFNKEFCKLKNQPSNLFHKQNESNFQNIIQRFTEDKVQPNLKLCMITRITKDIYDYASFSYSVLSTYSRYRNYLLFPVFPDSRAEDYEYHRKLVPILDLFDSSIYRCDYVVWIDADLIVLDFEFKFEELIHQHPFANIYISKDVSTISNTGCMMFRNTLWTKKFIKKWIDNKSKPTCYNEQTGFDELFHSMMQSTDANTLTEKVNLLPIHVLNSEAPAMWKQQPEHNILHLAAEDNAFRRNVFKRAFEEICQKENVQDLRPQLGLSRKSLQLIAIDTYGNISQSFEKKFSDSSKRLQDSFIFDINPRDLEAYRLQVSKYAYALAYYDREWRCEISSIDCDPIKSHYETEEIIWKRVHGHELFQEIVERFLFLILESTEKEERSSLKLSSSSKKILHERKLLLKTQDENSQHHQNEFRGKQHQLFLLLFSDYLIRNSTESTATSSSLSSEMNHFQELFQNPKKMMQMIETSVLRQQQHQPQRNQEILRKRMEFFYHEFPEILKMSLEIAYELLHIFYVNPHFLHNSTTSSPVDSPIITEERKELLTGIVSYMKILFELLSLLVSPTQLNIVQDMRRDFQSFIVTTGLDSSPSMKDQKIIAEEL